MSNEMYPMSPVTSKLLCLTQGASLHSHLHNSPYLLLCLLRVTHYLMTILYTEFTYLLCF